jgi:hypothetical protein
MVEHVELAWRGAGATALVGGGGEAIGAHWVTAWGEDVEARIAAQG